MFKQTNIHVTEDTVIRTFNSRNFQCVELDSDAGSVRIFFTESTYHKLLELSEQASIAWSDSLPEMAEQER